MARAFVIRPFNVKKDNNGKAINFEVVHDDLIQPALDAAGLEGGTTGRIVEPGSIREDMFKLILEADLVIADITVHNANVFYELGIRHALRKKRTVMIRGEGFADATPFDLLTDRYQPYDPASPAASVESLTRVLHAAMNSDRETDSPVFAMMEGLAEADPSHVTGAPADFAEEVARAKAAKAVGWLALLADEVRGRRFEWPGLKLIAEAQWALEDWDGARDNYTQIVTNDPDDIDANLALGNIYERLFRQDHQSDTLIKSDQAIERVLARTDLAKSLRAEAEALRARNLKSRWRQRVEAAPDLASSRAAAMNRELINAYKGYRQAYLRDLNAFYPGLTALQMGSVLRELSESQEWYNAFDTDDEADSYKQQLARELTTLEHLVPEAIDADIAQGTTPAPWPEISKADLQFLVAERTQRVIAAYEDAVPPDHPFAWGAAKGQLDLFMRLGIKAELATKIIAAIDASQTPPPAAHASAHRESYLLVVGGHTIDSGPDAQRFPAQAEGKARQLLKAQISALHKRLRDTHEIHVLASGAPGADILAHEICDELGIRSTMCLPMPANAYAGQVFGELDQWRTRFIRLAESDARSVRALSDRPGLPRWLAESDTDPWDRGNRWVMSMALASRSARTGMLVLWDKQEAGAGGTAQMVQLAREAGNVEVQIIDSATLTE
ncbi:MAG: hypothetical protein AAGA68_20705 [Pseudomonadota bacterium]